MYVIALVNLVEENKSNNAKVVLKFRYPALKVELTHLIVLELQYIWLLIVHNSLSMLCGN